MTKKSLPSGFAFVASLAVSFGFQFAAHTMAEPVIRDLIERHWAKVGADTVAILSTILGSLQGGIWTLMFIGATRTVNPKNARFLIQLLMANKEGDALLGDLEERFNRIAQEHGVERARFWYWFQVVTSLRPIAWAWLKRITGLAAAYEAIRRIIR
jgi:hypothetical protein